MDYTLPIIKTLPGEVTEYCQAILLRYLFTNSDLLVSLLSDTTSYFLLNGLTLTYEDNVLYFDDKLYRSANKIILSQISSEMALRLEELLKDGSIEVSHLTILGECDNNICKILAKYSKSIEWKDFGSLSTFFDSQINVQQLEYSYDSKEGYIAGLVKQYPSSKHNLVFRIFNQEHVDNCYSAIEEITRLCVVSQFKLTVQLHLQFNFDDADSIQKFTDQISNFNKLKTRFSEMIEVDCVVRVSVYLPKKLGNPNLENTKLLFKEYIKILGLNNINEIAIGGWFITYESFEFLWISECLNLQQLEILCKIKTDESCFGSFALLPQLKCLIIGHQHVDYEWLSKSFPKNLKYLKIMKAVSSLDETKVLNIPDALETLVIGGVEESINFNHLHINESSSLRDLQFQMEDEYEVIRLENFTPPTQLKSISFDIGEYITDEIVEVSDNSLKLLAGLYCNRKVRDSENNSLLTPMLGDGALEMGRLVLKVATV